MFVGGGLTNQQQSLIQTSHHTVKEHGVLPDSTLTELMAATGLSPQVTYSILCCGPFLFKARPNHYQIKKLLHRRKSALGLQAFLLVRRLKSPTILVTVRAAGGTNPHLQIVSIPPKPSTILLHLLLHTKCFRAAAENVALTTTTF